MLSGLYQLRVLPKHQDEHEVWQPLGVTSGPFRANLHSRSMPDCLRKNYIRTIPPMKILGRRLARAEANRLKNSTSANKAGVGYRR